LNAFVRVWLKTHSKTIYVVLRVVVPIACLALLYVFVDIEKSLNMLWHLPMHIILICIGFFLLRNWMCGLRWMTLLPSSHDQISRWGAFRYIMLGSLYGLILPGALGADVARSAQVDVEVPKNKASYVASIWLDRLVGLFSILLMGGVAGIFSAQLHSRHYFLIIMAAGLLFFLLLAWLAFHPSLHGLLLRLSMRYKRIHSLLAKLLSNLQELGDYHRTHQQAVWKALAYCIPIHCLAFYIVYLLAVALGIEIGFLALSLFTSISWLVTSIPVSFSGVGVREISFVVLLQTQGISAEQATTLSLGFFSVMMLTGLLGALFLFAPRIQQPQSQQPDQM
jgi:uncharacterized protein (TIRG00374 family)